MKLKLILLFFCFCTLIVSPAYAEDDSEHIIKYRQALMNSVKAHFQALKLLSSDKVKQPEQWLPHAKAMSATADMMKISFPEGSDFGETDALEAIWENKDDFDQKVTDFYKATKAISDDLEKSDFESAKSKIDKIGKSCKGCHKKYREK